MFTDKIDKLVSENERLRVALDKLTLANEGLRLALETAADKLDMAGWNLHAEDAREALK
jgi:hypothetical protein